MSRMPPENQSEARRIERMAEAYKLFEPSEQEIAAKRRRALPKALAGRASLVRGLAWATAAVLVTGGALAGGGWALRVLTGPPDSPFAPRGSVNAPAPSVSQRSPNASLGSSVAEIEPVPASAPSATAVQPHPAAPAQSSKKSSSTDEEKAERLEAESWKAVAEAMRDRDTRRAREALDRLSASNDGRTRDAADLARAKLDVARGDLSSARAVFERVAREGRTPQLKAQATRALGQLEGK